MERCLLIGGFGGQGVMVCGQLLSYTASETTEKQVTYFPSYGPEQRGGTANCYVTISDNPISSPVPVTLTDLMVLNDPSLEKFESLLRKGGNLFINSSVVKKSPKREDIHIISVPAGKIADELGNPRVQNLAMVGAFVGYTGILPPEKVMLTAERKLGAKRPHLIPINNEAFRRGMAIGQEALQKTL